MALHIVKVVDPYDAARFMHEYESAIQPKVSDRLNISDKPYIITSVDKGEDGAWHVRVQYNSNPMSRRMV